MLNLQVTIPQVFLYDRQKGRETSVSHPNWIMKQEEKVSMFEPWVDDSDTNQMFIWFSLFPSFQGKNVVKLVA